MGSAGGSADVNKQNNLNVATLIQAGSQTRVKQYPLT